MCFINIVWLAQCKMSFCVIVPDIFYSCLNASFDRVYLFFHCVYSMGIANLSILDNFYER